MGAFPLPVWIGAFLAWILVVRLGPAGGRAVEGFPGRALRAAVCTGGVLVMALIAKAFSDRLTWSRAAAIGVAIGVALAFIRWLRSMAVGRERTGLAEGLQWAFLQILAAYCVHPYVRPALVGGGDAYQYSLSLADFIAQIRAGVFPVFIGQSEFAFNGSIHTLRTAPYFVHLGALLDTLTLRTLPPFAVANLAIVASAVLGAVGSYAAMLLYAPTRAATASALAALYILSPALLGPLYGGDMVATFMAAPMIPWWVLGLATAVDTPGSWRPWIIQGAALAALWWAHPPMALWATALTAASWVWILARGKSTRSCLERMTVATLLCALLAAYEFASVLTLRLSPIPGISSTTAATVFGDVARNWKASLMPLKSHGSVIGCIQLGYSLIAASIAGLFAARSRKSASLLLCCMAALLVLLVPVPGVTSRLWSLVPHAVLDVTNAWPMQRFYPLLAALAAFAGLSAAQFVDSMSERRAALAAMAVAAAIVWSLSEADALIERNGAGPMADEQSARLFRPENVRLTQDSYMFFGFYPSYFSNSPMDPALETRLIDSRTMEVIADGSTMTSGRPPPDSLEADLREEPNGAIEPEIPIGPFKTSVLRFDFGGREMNGVLQVRGRTLFRDYRLPKSGADKSFGSGPTNGRVIAIQNSSAAADSIEMNFLPDSITDAEHGASRPFARVSVEPQSSGGHVIDLRSLVPFRAVVQANRPSFLETPRIFMPGYRARVNGLDVDVARTGAGLVGVPLAPGKSDVTVDYPGSPPLRWAFGVSAAGWLALALCVVAIPVVDRAGERRSRWLAPDTPLWRAVRILPVLALLCVLVPVGVIRTWPNPASHRGGAMRLVIRLPEWNVQRSEPLLTTGRTGAGDVIFINYLGHGRISVGHDSWGYGAAVSKPFVVDFLAPQVVEVSMGSLAQRSLPQQGAQDAGPRGVSVRWNGREILFDAKDSFPSGPDEVEVGKNPIGASTCVPAFTGELLEFQAVESWKR